MAPRFLKYKYKFLNKNFRCQKYKMYQDDLELGFYTLCTTVSINIHEFQIIVGIL